MFDKNCFPLTFLAFVTFFYFSQLNAQTMKGFEVSSETTIQIDQVVPVDADFGLISVKALNRGETLAWVTCTDAKEFPPVVTVGTKEYFFDNAKNCNKMVQAIAQNPRRGSVILRLNNETEKVTSVTFSVLKPAK